MKNYDTFTTELMKREEENRNFKKKMKKEVIESISNKFDYLGVEELTIWYDEDIYQEQPCYYNKEDLENLNDVYFCFRSREYRTENILTHVARDEKGVWVATVGDEELYLHIEENQISIEDLLGLLEYLEHITPEMIEQQRVGEESAKFNI